MDTQIQRSTLADVENIRKLTLDNNYNREKYPGVGFLELPVPSIEEYSRAIIDQQPVFCAKTSDGSFIGHIIGYSDAYFTEHFAGKSEIERAIVKHGTPPFIYIDQVAIDEKARGQGLGTHLLRYFIASCVAEGYKNFYSVTAHNPKNVGMSTIFEKHNFTCIDEVTLDEDMLFGIYKLTL